MFWGQKRKYNNHDQNRTRNNPVLSLVHQCLSGMRATTSPWASGPTWAKYTPWTWEFGCWTQSPGSWLTAEDKDKCQFWEGRYRHETPRKAVLTSRGHKNWGLNVPIVWHWVLFVQGTLSFLLERENRGLGRQFFPQNLNTESLKSLVCTCGNLRCMLFIPNTNVFYTSSPLILTITWWIYMIISSYRWPQSSLSNNSESHSKEETQDLNQRQSS